MELSAELFESTVRALRGDQIEQRKHPRAPARFRVKILPYRQPGMTELIEVWTRDISQGGIGLVSHSRFKVGMRFIVRLPRIDGGTQYLVCTVRNCVEQIKGVYVIGSSFEEIVAHAPPQASEPDAAMPMAVA